MCCKIAINDDCGGMMKQIHLVLLTCLWSISIGALMAWSGMTDPVQFSQYEESYLSSNDSYQTDE